MCGISGIFSTSKIERSTLEAFNRSLAHRGPDGEGYAFFENETVALAQRRLSILDLSEGGKQPMFSHNQRYCISYNGEVFNFIELRRELEVLGLKFNSDSDTEIILAAYEQWGIDAFHKFNGMWAIALWDNLEKKLLLIRDRFGIKPLYYAYLPGKLVAFASETNAFKQLEPLFSREIDEEKLSIALTDAYALCGKGHSIFKNIFQILPGHWAIVDAKLKVEQKRWFHIDEHTSNFDLTYEEQVKKFKDLFFDACALRLRSDVKVATALSGGLDSSSVYCTLGKLEEQLSHSERVPKDWQQAVVGIFPNTDQDEKEYADEVLHFLKKKAIYVDVVESDFLPELIKTTQHFDDITETPFLSLTGIYRGMKEAGITVSLDGHGADEMLYGYRNQVFDLFEHAKWNGTRAEAERYLDVLKGLYGDEKESAQSKRFKSDLQAAFDIRNSLSYKLKKNVKTVLGQGKSKNSPAFQLDELSDRPYDFSNKPYNEQLLYNHFFIGTLPTLLRNFDKAAMYSSIEIRMPFMDWRLVCFLFSLPVESKIGKGFTKLILRDAMNGVLPEKIKNRKLKIGLAAPKKEWEKRTDLSAFMKDNNCTSWKELNLFLIESTN